jgi:hypothetical protein
MPMAAPSSKTWAITIAAVDVVTALSCLRSSVTGVTAIFQNGVHLSLLGLAERCTMTQKRQEALLNALKLQLQFCEEGGYQTLRGRLPARASENDPMAMPIREQPKRELRREFSVFQDSPSCLNYGLREREHSCSRCWLLDFVPEERRTEAVPCHHIPLNERGTTVASLGGPADAPDLQQAVRAWLRQMIQQLEGEPAQSRQRAASG